MSRKYAKSLRSFKKKLLKVKIKKETILRVNNVIQEH